MAFRQIHDDVPLSGSLAGLSDFAERLYWRLLSQTDNWGRMQGELAKIRAAAIPLLERTDSQIHEALEELVAASRILLYCVTGRWYIQIVGFDENQPAIARIKRSKSRYPEPPSEKALHDRRSLKTEDRDSRKEISPTAEASYEAATLPFSISPRKGEEHDRDASGIVFHHYDLGTVCRDLRGADDRSPLALASVLDGMPEAALVSALEQLERRRGKQPRLDSEVRYLVGTLSTMRLEGQYGRAAV